MTSFYLNYLFKGFPFKCSHLLRVRTSTHEFWEGAIQLLIVVWKHKLPRAHYTAYRDHTILCTPTQSFLKKFSWSIVDLHCCVSFRCTAKWISYTYTYILSFPGFFSHIGYNRVLSIPQSFLSSLLNLRWFPQGCSNWEEPDSQPDTASLTIILPKKLNMHQLDGLWTNLLKVWLRWLSFPGPDHT